MTLTRRLFYLRRIFRIVPRLTDQLDSLEHLIPKLAALGPVLEKIGDLDHRVAQLEILEATLPRLEALDRALARIDRVGKYEAAPAAVQVVPVKPDHEYSRLKLLSKFAELAGKAEEIEKEWQKVQQDEHDAFFAFQVMRGNNEKEYAYKKGIVDGIKWCVERFS